jgi:uncharacterized 2Fe-2S/4Fe-4S cluster protein (DUF4445 family)
MWVTSLNAMGAARGRSLQNICRPRGVPYGLFGYHFVMSLLLIHSATGEQYIEVAEGQSVREALDTSDCRVRAACGGSGTCGACVVRLIGGEVSPPTVAEYMKLSSEERAAGTRLACQLRLRGRAEIQLDQPAPPSHWKSIPPQNLAAIASQLPELQKHIYGVAVDLGTTHIRVTLWDRRHGKRIASRCGPNPQGSFGADVLNRLEAARSHPAHATEMAKLARTAIIQAVRDILARDVGEVTPMLSEIGQVLIVGNTAMLALLTGHGGDALIDPDNWQRLVDCHPSDPAAWQAQWYMPHAEIVLPDPVAGFVGSDLLADLLASRLTEGPAGALLLDVGTNTELALWDGQHLHVTSVPGGPAFEGVGIRHGMAAEPGAIYSVRSSDDGSGNIVLETIGGSAARGFCGSGLTDAIAVLLASGRLKPSGRFAVSPGPEGYALDPCNPRTAITGVDVDAFQRAKAATAAAMAQLLAQAGMRWSDLRRLCVCGAFGHTLNIAHAQAVGLLPPIAPALIELAADASLAGSERALLSANGAAQFVTLASKIKATNLSLVADYEDRYIDHLRLRPINLDSAGSAL